MRRSLLTALAIVVIGYALPSPAQMRGGHSSVRFGGGVVVRPGFSGHGVGFRGGVAFGHSPRFGVVIGPRRVFHRPVFFRRPFFSFGFGYPYYPYAYVYPPYYYDSLYYSSYSYPPPPAYYSNDDSRLADEVYQLRGEVAQLRAEQQRDQEERAAAAPPPVPRPPQASRANEPAPPSIVLVFRDGHRSEVRNYAIVGQTLWMFSEEQARKVPLSTLDVDATTKANEQRGIEFRLPASAPPAR